MLFTPSIPHKHFSDAATAYNHQDLMYTTLNIPLMLATSTYIFTCDSAAYYHSFYSLLLIPFLWQNT